MSMKHWVGPDGFAFSAEVEIITDFSADVAISDFGAIRGVMVNSGGGALAFTTESGTAHVWPLASGTHFLPIRIVSIQAVGTDSISSVMAFL